VFFRDVVRPSLIPCKVHDRRIIKISIDPVSVPFQSTVTDEINLNEKVTCMKSIYLKVKVDSFQPKNPSIDGCKIIGHCVGLSSFLRRSDTVHD
jgi:hypothetical protein